MVSIADNTPQSNVADAASLALRMAAYPAGALTGYMAGSTFVRNSIYKNHAKHGVFDDVQKKFSKRFKAVLAEGFKEVPEQNLSADTRAIRDRIYRQLETSTGEGLTAAMQEAKALAPKSVNAKLGHLIDEYRGVVRDYFETLGIKGPLQYWHGSTPNQRAEAAVFGITAAAITIGAMLTIADHKGLLAYLTPNKDQPTKDVAR